MMDTGWVNAEVQDSQFSDSRLSARLKSMLSSLSENPEETILSNSSTWADAMGSYRFLKNEKASKDEILSGHKSATLERANDEKTLFLVQDTTFLKFTRDFKVHDDKGTIRDKKKEEVPLHLSVAFGAQRDNLGVIRADFYEDFKKRKKHKNLRTTPIEEKKSYRWIEHYETACVHQEILKDTNVVQIADRESDIHELFDYAQNQPIDRRADLIIRCSHFNRRVLGKDDDDEYLLDVVNQSKVLGEYEVDLPASGSRKARKATIEIKSTEVVFSCSDNFNRSAIALYAIQAKEVGAQEGQEGIDWILLTTLPAETFQQAQCIVGWYSHRWEIEIYFRVLKQGCKIEELKLQSKDGIEKAICVYMIIAWKLHHLTMISRRHPEKEAASVLTEKECKTIYLMAKKKKPPKNVSGIGINEMVRMLAKIGGFLGRKGDGEPGIKNIWRGYRKLMDYIEAIDAFEDICV